MVHEIMRISCDSSCDSSCVSSCDLVVQVKRGLEKLYRRIDGELTEEVGLLRVTWGAMQKAFIEQYEHFDKLMAKCYPGANMQLEFNLVNLNDYFMDISENK